MPEPRLPSPLLSTCLGGRPVQACPSGKLSNYHKRRAGKLEWAAFTLSRDKLSSCHSHPAIPWTSAHPGAGHALYKDAIAPVLPCLEGKEKNFHIGDISLLTFSACGRIFSSDRSRTLNGKVRLLSAAGRHAQRQTFSAVLAGSLPASAFPRGALQGKAKAKSGTRPRWAEEQASYESD